MLAEAKKSCKWVSSRIASRLSKIECTGKQRSIIYQCIVVCHTTYHFVPLIVAGIMKMEDAIATTLKYQERVVVGHCGVNGETFSMLITPE